MVVILFFCKITLMNLIIHFLLEHLTWSYERLWLCVECNEGIKLGNCWQFLKPVRIQRVSLSKPFEPQISFKNATLCLLSLLDHKDWYFIFWVGVCGSICSWWRNDVELIGYLKTIIMFWKFMQLGTVLAYRCNVSVLGC